MSDPAYQARVIAAIRHADTRRVDAIDELLAMWRLDGEYVELSLLDKQYLRDFVWTTLRTVARDPDLVAALNNVAQIYALAEDDQCH